MFAFHCPRHDARVLVWASDIDGIMNTAEGVGMTFHCSCGYRGILVERPGAPEVVVPLDTAEITVAA